MARSAGRPRDPAVDTTLLQSTRDLLLEVGFDRVSIDGVAARTGISKNTIYRRWASKTDLVVAAAAEVMPAPELPETGSLAGDLFACARCYRQTGQAQHVLAVILTEVVRNPQLRGAAQVALGDPYETLFVRVLERARERGELNADVDVAIIAAIFPRFAFHQVAVEGREVDEELVQAVIGSCVLPLLGEGATGGGRTSRGTGS